MITYNKVGSKILYIGPHKEDSDQGEICRGDILALHNHIDLVTRSVGRENFKDPTSPNQIPKSIEEKSLEGVSHIIQYGYPERWERYGDFIHIGYLDIDQEDISNERWVNNLQIMDEIWCSTSDGVSLIEQIYDGRTKLIPHAVDLDLYEKPYKILEIPEISGTFKFFCVSNDYKDQKLHEVIEAFFKEFDPTEPVSLILKASSQINEVIKGIKNKLQLYNKDAYQKIVLLDKNPSFDQFMGLFKYCNCFINQSNLTPSGIAQDLSTRHAIAFEKPIITFEFSIDIKSDMRYAYQNYIDGGQSPIINKNYLHNKEFCGKVLEVIGK